MDRLKDSSVEVWKQSIEMWQKGEENSEEGGGKDRKVVAENQNLEHDLVETLQPV
jgi:hypothetical protein